MKAFHLKLDLYPSSSRDMELLRSLCIGSLVLRNCLLRVPLIYPSSRRLNRRSLFSGLVLGLAIDVNIAAVGDEYAGRRDTASGSCSMVNCNIQCILFLSLTIF